MRIRLSLFLAICAVCWLQQGAAADVRLAVGPFFAAGTRPELQEDSRVIRELVLTELSASTRFNLVEREKVNQICDELKLNASGLVAREQVTRLGKLLDCERLVSGSLAMIDGHRHVWTKLIDVRSGIVLDLHSTFYEPSSLAEVAAKIARHLSDGGAMPKLREFATLGPFMDMTSPPNPNREDWSRRLAALIERHLRGDGVGVVELEAVGSIFEERRLQDAGLIRTTGQQVRIQPAFWLIDGGVGWVEGQTGVLTVGLRVQRVGGPEQRFWLTNTAEAAIDTSIGRILDEALRNTNRTESVGANAEPDLFAARAREMEFKRGPFLPPARVSGTRWDLYKKNKDDRQKVNERQHAVNTGYQRALLQDPNNHHAKIQLATAYLSEPDGARWSEGVEMLRELAAVAPPEFAGTARSHLENLELFRQIAKSGPVKPVRPDDWSSIQKAYAEEPDDPTAQFAYARHMGFSKDAGDRHRGREVLQRMVSSGDVEFAQRARELLQDLLSRETTMVSMSEQETREQFLKLNFSKFVPVQFQQDASGHARLIMLPVQSSMFASGGRSYFGVRFTLPVDLDGDLDWMFLLAKASSQKDFNASDIEWGLMPRSSQAPASISKPVVRAVGEFPELRRQFPYTGKFLCQSAARAFLMAGQEYSLWFSSKIKDFPDIAVAVTVDSEAGRRQYGALPVK